MTSSTLIHGRWIVTGAGRDDPVLKDAGLLARGGEIIESGPWTEIREAHPEAEVLGGPGMAVIPGMVNAHHHSIGITQQQQALGDDFLEPWILDHAGLRASDVAQMPRLASVRIRFN